MREGLLLFLLGKNWGLGRLVIWVYLVFEFIFFSKDFNTVIEEVEEEDGRRIKGWGL